MKKYILVFLFNISVVSSIQSIEHTISEECVQTTPCTIKGFYGASSVGVNFLQCSIPEPFKLDMSPGFFGNICLGYRYQNWRIETEVGYRSNTVNKFLLGDVTIPCDGYLNTTSVMTNVLLDLGPVGDPCRKCIPYYGFGVGYANSCASLCEIKENHANPAYQHIFGLSYRMTVDFDLSLEGRYFVPAKDLVGYNVALTVRKFF